MRTGFLICLAFSCLFLFEPLHGQIPTTCSFQGLLTDTVGVPKPDGSYKLTFRFYENSSGGSAIWTETQTVKVSRGLFYARLGEVISFVPAVRFDRPYWLSVQEGFGMELTPRIPITSVGYSFHTRRADTATIALTAPQQGYVDSARTAGTVRDQAITTEKLADNALTSTKIAMPLSLSRNLQIDVGVNKFVVNTTGAGWGSMQLGCPRPYGEVLISFMTRNGPITYGSSPIADRIWHMGLNPYGQSGNSFFITNENVSTAPPLAMTWRGNVGIGLPNPDSTEKLQVTGRIHSKSGGFKFPDGSIQTTAAGASLWQQSGSNLYYNDGNIAIGAVPAPSKLHVNGNVLFSGEVGGVPASGAGRKLMWIPAKGAFRAGYVNGSQWDDPNIGMYSTAMGYSSLASDTAATAMGHHTQATKVGSTAMGYLTTASGQASTAMGYGAAATASYSVAMGQATAAIAPNSTAIGYYTTASNVVATAMGDGTVASGEYSTAAGYKTTASGEASTAMGFMTSSKGRSSTTFGESTTASANYSTAMGSNTTASGSSSTAMGTGSAALGAGSTAMGWHTIASGDYSTAMGTYVTVGGRGSFMIGDASTQSMTGDAANNSFGARFAGGYFLSSASDMSKGVYMMGGTSGWTNLSDRSKKENFQPVDGELLLAKIRSMLITEWNYKGGDASIKYIGPVAQEFYAAFHLGGTDSLGINSISIDGVNMAAIQALEKRTTELRQKAAELETVKAELAEVKARLERLEEALTMRKDITQRVSSVYDRRGAQR